MTSLGNVPPLAIKFGTSLRSAEVPKKVVPVTFAVSHVQRLTVEIGRIVGTFERDRGLIK